MSGSGLSPTLATLARLTGREPANTRLHRRRISRCSLSRKSIELVAEEAGLRLTSARRTGFFNEDSALDCTCSSLSYDADGLLRSDGTTALSRFVRSMADVLAARAVAPPCQSGR